MAAPGSAPSIADWMAARRVEAAGSSLADVVGLRSAKREVESLIARLRHPETIQAAGGQLPRAVLFHGPAGTGKTSLARVIASALGDEATLYEVNTADLTPARLYEIRDFASARATQGYSVVFVDEVDIIAGHRDLQSHTIETRQVLYALLSVLDGLRPADRLVWLCSTNSHPDALDPALMRAGRIGYHIETSYPSAAEREELFRRFVVGRRLLGAFDWRRASELCGILTSGADIRQMLDDALALSLADGLDATDWPHLLEAIGRRGVVSPNRERPLSEQELRVASIHEAGHGLIAALCGLPLSRMVVEDDGHGRTEFEPADPRRQDPITDRQVLDTIASYLAGTLAERLVLGAGETTLGGGDDLGRATYLALRRLDAGVEPGFPLIARLAFDPQQPPALLDAAAASVAHTLEAQRALVERILDEHRDQLLSLADTLAGKRQLVGPELRAALANAGLPTGQRGAHI